MQHSHVRTHLTISSSAHASRSSLAGRQDEIFTAHVSGHPAAPTRQDPSRPWGGGGSGHPTAPTRKDRSRPQHHFGSTLSLRPLAAWLLTSLSIRRSAWARWYGLDADCGLGFTMSVATLWRWQHRLLSSILGAHDVLTAHPEDAHILVVPALATNMFACACAMLGARDSRLGHPLTQ